MLSLLFAVLSVVNIVTASPIRERSISSDLLDDLVRFTQYSSAAYQAVCPSPLGNVLVEQVSSLHCYHFTCLLNSPEFNDITTSTEGFIARDDTRNEIIVSFRGSFELQDFDTGSMCSLRSHFATDRIRQISTSSWYLSSLKESSMFPLVLKHTLAFWPLLTAYLPRSSPQSGNN